MKYKVTLNNRIYEVVVEEASAMLLDEYEAEAPAPCAVAKQEAVTADPAMIPIPSKAGAASNSLVSGEVVKAPMPGNVLKMEVAQGQEVEEGDLLLVLEAMKMENDIVAPKGGIVIQLVVDKGMVVETDDPLVVIA